MTEPQEFDRNAAVLAELDGMEPGHALTHASVRWTGVDGWQEMTEKLVADVREEYEGNRVDPRNQSDVAFTVADGIVSGMSGTALVKWFGMLDDVAHMRFVDPETGTDDDTFTATPDMTLRDVVKSAVFTVLRSAAGALITYLEGVADEDEEKWEEAQEAAQSDEAAPDGDGGQQPDGDRG